MSLGGEDSPWPGTSSSGAPRALARSAGVGAVVDELIVLFIDTTRRLLYIRGSGSEKSSTYKDLAEAVLGDDPDRLEQAAHLAADLNLAGYGIVKTLEDGHGSAYPDRPREPRTAFSAVILAGTPSSGRSTTAALTCGRLACKPPCPGS
ncbi:hypothetical protein [Streptomyces poriticola]|uniref:hypothetical protein n=1 Tax=Streptomyces poriticola TaxID=3120506 RepID=UPI002FCE5CD1